MDRDALKYEASQIIAECIHRDFPLLSAGLVILKLCDKAGLPRPADPFAWATGGIITRDDAIDFDTYLLDAEMAAAGASGQTFTVH